MTRLPLAPALAIALSLLPRLASADWIRTDLTNGRPTFGCDHVGGDVHRWTWADAPQVTFIVDRILGGSPSFLALGADEDGLWTLETDEAAGGSDWRSSHHLRHTGWDGSRQSFVVHEPHEYRDKLDQTRALVTQRLWEYVASGTRAQTPLGKLERIYRMVTFRSNGPTWSPQHLDQTYAFKAAPHDDEGTIAHYPGWLLQATSGSGTIRFTLDPTRMMCWCGSKWRGWRSGTRA